MPTLSQDFSAISSVTTLFHEQNNADSNANKETRGTGVFLAPSLNVPLRPSDVTGYFVVAATEEGKLEYHSGDGLLSLVELSDVTLTAPVSGQLLNFNGTFWENATPTLNYLDDVTITAPIAGDLLSWNGSDWVNAPAGAATAGLPVNSVQFNSGGLFAGSPAFTFDGVSLVTVAGTVSATTVTDTVASMTAGALSGVTDVGCATVTASGAVGCASVTATGAVQGLSVTDGVAVMTAGSISGAVDVTATGNVALGNVASTLGLYGVAPVPQAAAVVPPLPLDLASTISAVNAIILALKGVGITL